MREVERKYRVTPDPEVFSKPITMDFQGISLKNAFRLLAEQAGVNLIVGPEVEGSVTMRLFHVPLGQVIDQILKANQLERELIGNVIRIDKRDAIQESKDARAKQYENEIKVARRKLARNKADVKKLEEEREKGLQELRKMETDVGEFGTAEQAETEIEHLGQAESIDIDGETFTFQRIQIKLAYVLPSKLVPILECIFNQRCGQTAQGGGKADKSKKEDKAYQKELEKQGFPPGWGGNQARQERFRREQRAEERLQLQKLATLKQLTEGGPGVGYGQDEVRLQKFLGYTVMWANDEFRRLFIKDLPDRIADMKRVIASLDIPKPQVLIESRLVQADRAWGRGLGIVWGGRNNQQGYLRNGSKNSIWGVTGGYTAGINTPSLSDRQPASRRTSATPPAAVARWVMGTSSQPRWSTCRQPSPVWITSWDWVSSSVSLATTSQQTSIFASS